MPDTSTLTTDALDPAVARWLTDFAAQPLAALDRLLLGEVWLGPYAAAQTAQTLPQFFPLDRQDALDRALVDWLAGQLAAGQAPETVAPKRYAQALIDAFALLQAMDLPKTHAWCGENVARLWAWLKTQALSPARDPRPTFLRALAQAQPDRRLLPFWTGLCRQGQRDHAQLALFGLRRLPKDDRGTVEHAIPPALIQGLLDYGRAAARSGEPRKKEWLAEVDFLTAVYPMPRDKWAAPFREALGSDTSKWKRLRDWLDERHPGANQPAPGKTRRRALEAPHWDHDIQPLLDRYDRDHAALLPALQAQLEHHNHYARETGDSAYLVRSFCRLGEHLLQPGPGHKPRDPAWALELGQEAAAWQPGDPRSWALVARALDTLGDWTRARAVFWYARRRFPHNPHSHNQLGHALAMRGALAEGEAVYRQAIRRFPEDPVCWADLAHTLRVAGKLDEALAVYREARAIDAFHKDPVLACGMTGVLIELGRVQDAEAALAWAEFCGDSPKDQRVLDDLRRRLKALAASKPMPAQHPHPTPEIPAGGLGGLSAITGIDLGPITALGEAALWRNAGAIDRAGHLLDALAPSAIVLVERGLCLAGDAGWPVAREHFQAIAARHPGDGAIQVHYQRARARCQEAADWQALWGRFEEYAPIFRVEQAEGPARLPDDLRNDDLDEAGEQARWVYLSSGDAGRRDLVEEDFIAARQIAG